MTTVFEREVSGRRTHALVIGVGDYPGCRPDSRNQVARGIRPLTSAPVTATRVARWLLERQRDDPVAPLASLDVAITPYPGQERRVLDAPDGEKLSRATWEGVTEAFRGWRDRCDRSGDSVAWFYFCGHGLSPDPYSQVLLLEDFNADEYAPFSTAVDFGGTYTGMERVRARTQLFFLDTCREIPLVPPGMAIRGRELIEPDGTLDGRSTALVTYATGFGHRAYAPEGGASRFSSAVLDTLDGLGAVRDDTLADPRWRVPADTLSFCVERVLQFRREPDDPRQFTSSMGTRSPEGLLRGLDGPPSVPFRIGCLPDSALSRASLSLHGLDGASRLRRHPPLPLLWEDEAASGAYRMSAEFDGAPWADTTAIAVVQPPYHANNMRIEEAR